MIRKYTSSFLIILSFVVFFSAFYSLERAWADPVVATIPVGNFPQSLAYDSDNKEMYVTNFEDKTVSAIDTSKNQVVGNPIPVGNQPFGIAYDSDTKEMYMTNVGDDSVSVIDTSKNQVVGNLIPVKLSPVSIAYDSINKEMYVVNDNSNSVSVIDTSTQTVVGNPYLLERYHLV